MGVMEGFLEGKCLRATQKLGETKDIKELAIRFILYGTLSEIFARETGSAGGLTVRNSIFQIPIKPGSILLPGCLILSAEKPRKYRYWRNISPS